MPYDTNDFKILVIAGSYSQFSNFIFKHKLRGQNYSYVNNEQVLIGVHHDNCMMLRIGTWWLNEVYQSERLLKLEQYLHRTHRLATIDPVRRVV